jgi:hypothetical protein
MPGAGWEAHATLASIMGLRGDWGGAVKEYDTARGMAKDPITSAQLHEGVVMLQLAARKHDAAMTTIGKLESETKGKDANAYVGAGVDRAIVDGDRGRWAAAQKSLDEVLTRAESAELSAIGRADLRRFAFTMAAWVQAGLGKADGAQASAAKLEAEIGPAAAKDQDLASQLAFAQGEAALAKGDAAGAVTILSRCVRENDLCRAALATAQDKAGDKQAAAATRAAILAANHTDPFSLWVRSRLPPPAAAKVAKPTKKK